MARTSKNGGFSTYPSLSFKTCTYSNVYLYSFKVIIIIPMSTSTNKSNYNAKKSSEETLIEMSISNGVVSGHE